MKNINHIDLVDVWTIWGAALIMIMGTALAVLITAYLVRLTIEVLF